MNELNAMGQQCPKPVMMAKKELSTGANGLAILVSSQNAVNNVTHLGQQNGYTVTVSDIKGGWRVVFEPKAEYTSTDDINNESVNETDCNCRNTPEPYAVFIGKDHVGEGDATLGYNLMKMAIYTLSESEHIPAAVLFMNSGVKLVCSEEAQIIDSVASLIEQGSEVLVCGTCLDFYGLKDQLKIGTVSNMYDILGRMQTADKTITL